MGAASSSRSAITPSPKSTFFATYNNRPVCWACQEDNWPKPLLEDLIGTLPSQPSMSRRLRTIGVLQLIQRVQSMLAEKLDLSLAKNIDSKPLVVGSYSKDRDAKRGRASKEMARGYKLHALCIGKSFMHWTLTGLNTNDQMGAAMLLPRLSGWGYVSADNGYDANAVHLLTASVNHQLIAPPRKSNVEVRDTRRNTPERIRSLDICANPLGHCGLGESMGLELLRGRKQIERNFGNVVMDGLYAPPPWVRTPHRVAIWAAAKLSQRMLRQIEIARLRI